MTYWRISWTDTSGTYSLKRDTLTDAQALFNSLSGGLTQMEADSLEIELGLAPGSLSLQAVSPTVMRFSQVQQASPV